jgi:hypothetical protein
MMFDMIIPNIVFNWEPLYIQFFWRTLSVSQLYLMSMAFDRFCLIVSFRIMRAVELSIFKGLSDCLHPT